jgi:glycosyltransferase involved in cell wall biosynthesis
MAGVACAVGREAVPPAKRMEYTGSAPMRILFVTKYYPPEEGGIERYGHMLCSDLAARGIDVEVVAASGTARRGYRQEVVDGVKVHRLGCQFSISSAPVTLRLPGLLHEIAKDFDLLHLNSPNPWADILHMAICGDRKTILTYHADIYRPPGSVGGMLLKAYKPLIHRLLNGVAGIIATSPTYIDSSPFLQRQREKARVIPMPVDMAIFADADADAVAHAVARFGTFVLFVGRLVAYKGLPVLIDAVDRVAGIRLVIAGRGPLEGELQGQVAARGLGDRVHFTGKISDEELKNLYHACLCFALPSISRAEAFGIVMAEAMSCGKPVISTDLDTGTTYVNKDGVTGFVVPPHDPEALAAKLQLLLEDGEACRHLGERARQRVAEKFDKPIVVAETLRLYEEVLAGGTGAA